MLTRRDFVRLAAAGAAFWGCGGDRQSILPAPGPALPSSILGNYSSEGTLATFALAVLYDRDEQRAAAFSVLDHMQHGLQQQYGPYVANELAKLRPANAEDVHYYRALFYESIGQYVEARAEWAHYAASGDTPWRARALAHIASIDAQRRARPGAPPPPALIAPRLPLSLFPLRLNEFMSINNVETFAAHFNVERCYTSNTDAALWFDFGAKANGRSVLDSMPVIAVTRADTIRLGKKDRQIDVMQAPIRLIATRWLYDRATRTLFSSDLFTHVWRAGADGPWIVTEDDDGTTERELRSFMLNTRYWWLEGAPTDSIRRGIDDVFAGHDVETIAPGYGCILRGRKVVARHVRMLDEVLKGLDRSVAVSRYVARDEER